jgi:hypothetical protein
MPEPNRLEQFRLALSYLERIEGELAHWTKLRADKQLARTKYDEVRARYDQHVGRARRAVDDMRRTAKHEIPAAETLVDNARQEQKTLVKQAAKGGADAAKLNARGREVAARLAQFETQLEELRTIVEAKSTGELGGGVDLPLEEYPRRLDLLPAPPRISIRRLTPLQSNLLSGAFMLLLVLGAVGLIYFWRGAPSAEFIISDDLTAGYVEVRCENEGNRPLYLYVPWPNGRAEPLPGLSRSSNSWGILLFVRIVGERDFRLYEDAADLWKIRGTYVGDAGPVTIRGASRARVFLDLDSLHATGIDAEAVRIECTAAGGSVLARRQIDLPAGR